MPIVVSLGALASAEPALHALATRRLSPTAAYAVMKLIKAAVAEIAHFHSVRNALIQQLGVPAEDGFTIPPDSPALAEYGVRVAELIGIAVELPCPPLTLAMLGDEPIAAADLVALGPLLADE